MYKKNGSPTEVAVFRLLFSYFSGCPGFNKVFPLWFPYNIRFLPSPEPVLIVSQETPVWK